MKKVIALLICISLIPVAAFGGSLTALVTANDSMYSEVQSFHNTFESIVKNMKGRMDSIKAKLLADGNYANWTAAKNDLATQMTSTNAAVANTNYTKAAELFTLLNAYNENDPVATRAAAIENIMLKVEEISPLMSHL